MTERQRKRLTKGKGRELGARHIRGGGGTMGVQSSATAGFDFICAVTCAWRLQLPCWVGQRPRRQQKRAYAPLGRCRPLPLPASAMLARLAGTLGTQKQRKKYALGGGFRKGAVHRCGGAGGTLCAHFVAVDASPNSTR